MARRTYLIAAVLTAGMAPCLVGCSTCKYTCISSLQEPTTFNRKVDRAASLAEYLKLAEEVWHSSGVACPCDRNLTDYRAGFIVGFADYVYAGGDGSPPAVPPREYWCVGKRTPEGAVAVQSWFAGYRHGAEVAREGGYRRFATVEVAASVWDCTACGCPDDGLEHSCTVSTSSTTAMAPEQSPPDLVQPSLNPPEQQASPEVLPYGPPDEPQGLSPPGDQEPQWELEGARRQPQSDRQSVRQATHLVPHDRLESSQSQRAQNLCYTTDVVPGVDLGADAEPRLPSLTRATEESPAPSDRESSAEPNFCADPVTTMFKR